MEIKSSIFPRKRPNNYLYIERHGIPMGLLDSLPEGPIRGRLDNGDKSLNEITLADLKKEFGVDALARGLAYMDSLSDADENYREAADNQYGKGLKDAGVIMDEQTEEEINEAWQEGMENKGIGMDDG